MDADLARRLVPAGVVAALLLLAWGLRRPAPELRAVVDWAEGDRVILRVDPPGQGCEVQPGQRVILRGVGVVKKRESDRG